MTTHAESTPPLSGPVSCNQPPLVNTCRCQIPIPSCVSAAKLLPADLQALFAELDQFQNPIPAEVLEEKIAKLTFKLADIKDFVQFDDHNYCRNLLHEGPQYHALLLCWKSGQRSPIHDHHESACGIRIIHGSALETVFQQTPGGYLYPTISQELGVGFVCANCDLDIHQLSNLQTEGQPLITLHIYSPPLQMMGAYSLTSPILPEPCPALLFTDGAGI